MKMPNFLDYLFGFFISTLVFFIVLAVVLFGVESNVNSDIKHKASKFVNESCVSGKLDADGFWILQDLSTNMEIMILRYL